MDLIEEIVKKLSDWHPNLDEVEGVEWLKGTMLKYFKDYFLKNKLVPPCSAVIMRKSPVNEETFYRDPQVLFVMMPGKPSVGAYIHALEHVADDADSPGLVMGVSMWVVREGERWVPASHPDDPMARPAICAWFDHATYDRKMWVSLIDVDLDSGDFSSMPWEENEYPPSMQLVHRRRVPSDIN